MLPRLANVLANSGRGLASLCYRLFPEKRDDNRRNVVAQQIPAFARPQMHDRQSASNNTEEVPAYAEFIRTQSQLMETMLHSMIIACGEKVEIRTNGTVQSSTESASLDR